MVSYNAQFSCSLVHESRNKGPGEFYPPSVNSAFCCIASLQGTELNQTPPNCRRLIALTKNWVIPQEKLGQETVLLFIAFSRLWRISSEKHANTAESVGNHEVSPI